MIKNRDQKNDQKCDQKCDQKIVKKEDPQNKEYQNCLTCFESTFRAQNNNKILNYSHFESRIPDPGVQPKYK